MAIFSLSVSCVKRSEGSSAIASASYILDRTLYDASLDRDFRFGSDTSQKHKTTLDLGSRLPDGTDIDTERLWNAAERMERKSNSRTARKIMVALPIELSQEQHIEIIDNFRKQLEERYQVATTAGIHYEHKHNPHAHLMITTREVKQEEGRLYFGDKTRILDDKKTGSLEIERIRESWEITCNRELEREKARIDRRSFKRQGIERTPGLHIGMKSYALLRKNLHSDRLERAGRIGEIRRIEEDILDARRLWRLQMERIKSRAARSRRERHESITRQTTARRIEQENGILTGKLEEARRETEARLKAAGFQPERDIAENNRDIDAGRAGERLSVASLLEAGRAGGQDQGDRTKTIGEILKSLDEIKANREVKSAAELLKELEHGQDQDKKREMDRGRTYFTRDL